MSDSYLPCLGGSGNTIHIVWQDNRDGKWAIYYKRSTDSGTTWGVDTRLSTGAEDSQNLVVAVLGNNVHVIWQDSRDGLFEIYYKRSTDGGTTWASIPD